MVKVRLFFFNSIIVWVILVLSHQNSLCNLFSARPQFNVSCLIRLRWKLRYHDIHNATRTAGSFGTVPYRLPQLSISSIFNSTPLLFPSSNPTSHSQHLSLPSIYIVLDYSKYLHTFSQLYLRTFVPFYPFYLCTMPTHHNCFRHCHQLMPADMTQLTQSTQPEESTKSTQSTHSISTKEFLEPFRISRLNELRKLINDPVYSYQKVNIAVAIKMYESGELPEAHGRFTWFVDGKVMKNWWPKSVGDGVAIWNEVRLKTVLYFHIAYVISRGYTFK